jgi:nickel-dependent lactate racemase
VASCGGHPYDINLLQMHKGLRNAALCARDGGQVVLAAKGGQGVGSATLERGLAHGTWREADAAARSSYVLNAHTAVALLQQAARVTIRMVSEVRELECARSWARHYMDAQEAFDAALAAAQTERPTIYYMPLAGITVPLSAS